MLEEGNNTQNTETTPTHADTQEILNELEVSTEGEVSTEEEDDVATATPVSTEDTGAFPPATICS